METNMQNVPLVCLKCKKVVGSIEIPGFAQCTGADTHCEDCYPVITPRHCK